MKWLIILMLSMIVGFVLQAQTKSIKKLLVMPEVTPENVGMLSERHSRIDNMCVPAVRDGNVPGVVTLVALNGEIIHWKSIVSSLS